MSIPLMPPPTNGPPPLPMFVGPPPGAQPPYGPTLSFAIPVPGPPGVMPPAGMLPGPQSVMPVGQPLVPVQQPCMALVQQLTQPMISAMMPQVMPPGYSTMQQPAPGGYWPVQSAPPPTSASVPISGGVSGLQNPSAPLQPSVSAHQSWAHVLSPTTSPLQSMPSGATGQRVRFEDDEEIPNGTSGHTGTPAIVIDGEDSEVGAQSKKRRLEDAIDWIHDHTIGRCQLCERHGHIARNCPQLPPKVAIPGGPRVSSASLNDDQTKWQERAGKLSFICVTLIPDPDCQSLSYEVMMQHLLEVLCENTHNTDLVYDFMQEAPFGWTWFCVRAVCDTKYMGMKVLQNSVEATCDYCAKRDQLVNFCLQIQPRKHQHALYREVATPKP